MDWDDYRYFSAVAQAGSVRGAATVLGVNASTVTRRLDQLESALGVSLFLRSNKGLAITTEGVEVAERIDDIAARFDTLEASVKGRDQRVGGRIHIALPNALAARVLVPELARFTELYPDIVLDLVSGQRVDPRSSEVDVLLRVTDAPPEFMIGRRIGPVSLAAYAGPDFAARHPDLDVSTGLPWVEWAGDSELALLSRDMRTRYFPDVKVAMRCDQIEMLCTAIAAGVGMGILPCCVGAEHAGLQQMASMPVTAGPELWVLTHPSSRSVRRIQLFLAFLRDTLAGQAERLAAGLMGAIGE